MPAKALVAEARFAVAIRGPAQPVVSLAEEEAGCPVTGVGRDGAFEGRGGGIGAAQVQEHAPSSAWARAEPGEAAACSRGANASAARPWRKRNAP